MNQNLLFGEKTKKRLQFALESEDQKFNLD